MTPFGGKKKLYIKKTYFAKKRNIKHTIPKNGLEKKKLVGVKSYGHILSAKILIELSS